MAIPFTMTIDTEEEWDWDSGWPTDNLSLENVQLLPRFQSLCERYGISATYFVNRAVLDSPPARDVVLRIAERPNVEIGMHIHPWNTPPIIDNGPVRARDTFLHNLPVAAVHEKLTSVYECFQGIGLKPTSFRGGRYSSGGRIHDFLQEQGFVADASICPFTSWPDEGAPDYRHRGLEPARLPPKAPRQSALWEIPLTLAFTRRPFHLWRACYELVERSWLSKLRLIGVCERLGIVRKVWLNFESPLGAHMLALLDRLHKQSVQTICFTVHSSSLMPGGNSFTKTQADADRLFGRLESVFAALCNNPAFRPATVTEVAHHLELMHHASSRN